MCGRFLLETLPGALAEQFRTQKPPVFEKSRYNIAPTQPILTAQLTDGAVVWHYARWGLIPAWSKDSSNAAKMINARSETVAEKPAFRQAFKHRRCLIPATAFYEWIALPSGKQPMLIALKSTPLFAFAGLYEDWRDPSTGAEVRSATILTTNANLAVEPIHARMPVIISAADYLTWLSPTIPNSELLRPWDAADMQIRPVSKRVNSSRIDDVSLIDDYLGDGNLAVKQDGSSGQQKLL